MLNLKPAETNGRLTTTTTRKTRHIKATLETRKLTNRPAIQFLQAKTMKSGNFVTKHS